MRRQSWLALVGIPSALVTVSVLVAMVMIRGAAPVVPVAVPAHADEVVPASPSATVSDSAGTRPMSGTERTRLRRQLVANLAGLRARVATCEAHAGKGESIQHGHRAQETILTLDIEVLDGQMHIVDTSVQVRGAASDAFVACAQSSLRGQLMRAPAAKAAGRLRMPLALGFRTDLATAE